MSALSNHGKARKADSGLSSVSHSSAEVGKQLRSEPILGVQGGAQLQMLACFDELPDVNQKLAQINVCSRMARLAADHIAERLNSGRLLAVELQSQAKVE